MTLAAVVSLFLGSGPPAVVGSVRSVVVDAVERQAGRGLAHISKEIDEVEPAFANGDAASAITVPLVIFGIEAPSFHAGPANVRTASFKSISMTMSILGCCRSFALDASTTGCGAAQQIVADDDCFGSAVAFTEPSCVRSFLDWEREPGQASVQSVGW